MHRDVGGPGTALSNAHPPSRGSVLVEVLIAALLLALGSVAIAATLRTAWRGLASASAAAGAVGRLGDLGEEMRAALPAERAAVIAGWQAADEAGGLVTPRDGDSTHAMQWVAQLRWSHEPGIGDVAVSQWIGLPPP